MKSSADPSIWANSNTTSLFGVPLMVESAAVRYSSSSSHSFILSFHTANASLCQVPSFGK